MCALLQLCNSAAVRLVHGLSRLRTKYCIGAPTSATAWLMLGSQLGEGCQ
jgi:hypothetical protein